MIDASMFAAIAALRAFRKPETSVISAPFEGNNLQGSKEGMKSSQRRNNSRDSRGAGRRVERGGAGFTIASNPTILVHSSNDREPLPLSMQHSPLTVTVGLFKYVASKAEVWPSLIVLLDVPYMESLIYSQKDVKEDRLLLVVDPSLAEAAAIDGAILFSINAHRSFSD